MVVFAAGRQCLGPWAFGLRRCVREGGRHCRHRPWAWLQENRADGEGRGILWDGAAAGCGSTPGLSQRPPGPPWAGTLEPRPGRGGERPGCGKSAVCLSLRPRLGFPVSLSPLWFPGTGRVETSRVVYRTQGAGHREARPRSARGPWRSGGGARPHRARGTSPVPQFSHLQGRDKGTGAEYQSGPRGRASRGSW